MKFPFDWKPNPPKGHCSRCGEFKELKPLKFEGEGGKFTIRVCKDCMRHYTGGGV